MSDNRNEQLMKLVLAQRMDRRKFVKLTGAAGMVAGIGPLLAACGGDDDDASGTGTGGSDGGPTGRALKIGYASPQTGSLASFGEADSFVVGEIQKIIEGGIDVGGTTHPVEIIVKDTQSDPARAAEVAGELILDDGVDIIIPGATPETTNPVSDTAEANGTPCISTVCPWQPWFFGRDGDAEVGFEWTYHYFWGLEDIIAVFLDMWPQVPNNKVVGAIWPNDADGNAWGDPEQGFPPPLEEAGYTIVDPGRFPSGTEDFTAQITEFKQAGVEIVTGVPIPPDFTTFWTQAAQQDFHPKIVSVGKALLFPASVDALGDLGEGMSTEVWWSPTFPFASSLDGMTSQALGDAYQANGSQWTQPLGYVYSVFEVAIDVFKRTTDVDDKAAIVESIKATNLDTIAGTVNWTEPGPVPNVAKMKLAGGQWQTGTDYPYDLVVVSNSIFPEVETAGELQPVPGS